MSGTITPPPGTIADLESHENWKKAAAVVKMVKASQGFKTLRDMLSGDAFISSDRITLQKPLGEGGFAFVNLALLDGTRMVAVKTLKPELLDQPDEVQHFLAENELMRKIRHPSIVELIGIGGTSVESGFQDLFIVQEFCGGGSLRDLVLKQMTSPKKLYSQADALRWALHIATALNYLHTAKPKIIHRDLKLDNVLLTVVQSTTAAAKLADFGLAKLVEHTKQRQHLQKEIKKLTSLSEESWTPLQRQRSAMVTETLTSMDSGHMTTLESIVETTTPTAIGEMTACCGSYAYMAPEVLRGEEYNEQSDIFSFGILVYNLFYRVLPSVLLAANGGGSEDIVLLAYRTANGYRPTLSTTSVPAEVNALIQACWSGVPGLRPTAEGVVSQIEVIQKLNVCPGASVVDGNERASTQGCSCLLM